MGIYIKQWSRILHWLFSKENRGETTIYSDENSSEHLISLEEVVEIEAFIMKNSLENMIFPKLLYKIFHECIELKRMRKIISTGKILISNPKDEGKKDNQCPEEGKGGNTEHSELLVSHREFGIFRYLKINEILFKLLASILQHTADTI